MTSQTTFYLSQILGRNIRDDEGFEIGKLVDIIIDFSNGKTIENESIRPLVTGIKIKGENNTIVCFLVSKFDIHREASKFNIYCSIEEEIPDIEIENHFLLAENILSKQIVDLNGKKLVRAHDIRLVAIAGNSYVIAVDVGLEAFFRKIGIAKFIVRIYKIFNGNLNPKFILWNDVEAVDYSNYNIKLSRVFSRLHTLHPSDLADIIEDMGKTSASVVFSSLDNEKAADVLEELQTKAQVRIIENLTVEKAADVLEKMPANEAADIIEELEADKAEELLKEMESDASQDIRELLEYPDNSVGSLMTTEVISFHKNTKVEDVLKTFRKQKPDVEALYNIYVTGTNEKLIANVPLRELLISEPSNYLSNIMNKNPIFLYDTDKIDSLAEMVSKYNLLAIPVTNINKKLLGMVIIDDIIEDLVNERKTYKR
ncbi:MAG: magnesium transporter [Bacteroidales bacterium]